ncbi:MAG TPA: FtsX-like permease family protein [Thermomicrobiales bacterium]|nr:FtsX-like permease family protein [Thermomicrobiales bacterium]
MARAVGARRRAAFVARPGAALALLRRLPRNGGALAILAGVVLVAGFSLAALPGFVARMSDDGLRQAVGAAPPYARDIALTQVSPGPLLPDGSPTTADLANLGTVGGDLQAALPPAVRGVIARRTVVADGPRWIVQDFPGVAPFPFPRYLQLRYQSDGDGQVRLVAGRLPAPHAPATLAQLTGNPAAGADPLPVFETAFTQETAQALGLRVGDRVIVVSDPAYWRQTGLVRQPAPYRVVIEVVGIVAARDQDDEYWFGDPTLLRPNVIDTPDVTLIYATGLLAPDDFATLQRVTSPEAWTYQWRYFVAPERLTQAGAADLGAGLQRLGFIFPPTATRATTGLGDLLGRFAGQRQLAVSVLALAAVGLTAVAAVVLGVLAALLAERRRPALELVRSRGASTGQLVAAQFVEGLALGVPLAALGWAVAVALLPAPDPRWPAAAAGGVALATALLLAGATLAALRRDRGVAARGDHDRRVALLRRLLAEAVVLGLAIAGVALLRRRGLGDTQRGVDPYLVAVPLLLGLATGLVVLRLTPLLVRLGARPAARGRGFVAFLGLRRLARPVGAQLPLLAVLLAVALAAFAATIQGSITRAQSDDAWRQVGADYRLDLPIGAPPAPPALDFAGVAGVGAVARSATIPADQNVPILALDLAAYARVAAGTPADPRLAPSALAPPTPANLGEKGNPIPAIVSASWPLPGAPGPGAAFDLTIGGTDVNFVAREVRDRFPGLPAGSPFVVASLDALQAAGQVERGAAVTTYYLRAPAHLDGPIGAAARARGADGTVTSRRAVFDRARGAPLVAGVTTGFRWSLALTALLAALAVAAVAEGVARARARERAALRLLGLGERQALALAVLELLPPLAVAGVAGGALGVALGRLLGPAIDLTVFLHATAPGLPVALRPDWATVALLAGAVGGVALVAALLVGALVGRISPNQLLREEHR